MPFTYGAACAPGFFSLVGYLSAHLVDAGTREEFSIAHIAGSKNIPAPEIASRHAEIGPPTDHVVAYARSSFWSARAAQVLRGIGFHSVLSAGSMDRWSIAGVDDGARAVLPLVKEERKP